MIKEIKQKIEELEIENNIKILYACESGSRAWGFASPDSDFDIRFIYSRNMEDYLVINEKPDTLEFPIINNLDFSGWDIKKFLQHINKSNGVMFEWLQSPTVYEEKFNFQLECMKLSNIYFRAKPTLYHYLGLVKRTFTDIKASEKVKIKRYFYALRPILAALYIAENKKIPPMDIHSLLKNVKGISDINESITNLMNEKEKSEEAFLIERIPTLDNFVENEMSRLNEIVVDLPDDKKTPDLLNNYLYQTISEKHD